MENRNYVALTDAEKGKLNHGFVIPIGHFVRWYMCVWHF